MKLNTAIFITTALLNVASQGECGGKCNTIVRVIE